jgi:PAS domain S-box-containing protein
MTPPASTMIEKIQSAGVRLGRRQERLMDRMADPHGNAPARPVHYGVAILMVTLGFGARELIGPAELGLQFITFFPAVALSAVFGGFWPGMLATALAALLATWRYLPPYDAFPFAFNGATLLSNLAFLLDELVVCAAIEAMHNNFRNLRRASARLAEKRNQLHAIVEGTADPIFLQDRDGRYLHSNRAHLALSGKRIDQVIGRDVFAVFPPARAGAIRASDSAAATLAAGQSATFEEVLGAPDGGERTLLTTKGPLFDQQGRLSGLFGISHDITERQRVEAERRREHALLSAIANATDVMLVYLDRDFNFLWVNQAYAECCRVAPEQMVGKNHFALYPDAENEAIFRAVRDGGPPVFQKDKAFAFPDQPERGLTYWDWSLSSDRDAHQRVRGLVLSLRETTPHVRARQAVGESEQRFAALADAAPVLIWMSGPNRRATWFNQQWLDFTGRTLERELALGWLDGIHPDDLARCLEHNNDSLQRHARCQIDYRRRGAGGHYRWLTEQAVPRHSADGLFLGYIGACADVTERRLAEDALRENQQKLSVFIDGAPAGIAMFDRDMRYLAVSRRFLDDYHLAERELIGRCHYEVFPAIHERWRAIHRRCLAGESQRCEEEAFRRADGSVHWLRWEVRPWHTAAGAVGGVILFSECINARKQGEHELRLAKAEAEQANHAKSRFLAAASHDLRQPLAALALYVGALKNKLAPADAPLLGNMVDCVANLNELLTDLLDISKLDAGVVQPDVCDFAVADLLAGLAAVHAPEARRKGLRYRQREPAWHARTDPRLLRRIVGNLLANAVRYTERGGVLVGCRRRGGKNWIEVWDSGIGVPQDKHDEIFQEFRQLGHDERNRGSGLGLAIAAKSAALLGLQIRVRSRPGKGSLFAVELPPGRSGAVAPAPAAGAAPARRIGVVDDNPAVLQALACSLRAMGHQVVAAADAAQLLQRLAGTAPAIVVSDFRLAGGQTGLDVIAAARAAFGPRLPALLITGDTDPSLMRGMSEHGIPIQHKPLAPDALLAAIEQVIAGQAGSGAAANRQLTTTGSTP